MKLSRSWVFVVASLAVHGLVLGVLLLTPADAFKKKSGDGRMGVQLEEPGERNVRAVWVRRPVVVKPEPAKAVKPDPPLAKDRPRTEKPAKPAKAATVKPVDPPAEERAVPRPAEARQGDRPAICEGR